MKYPDLWISIEQDIENYTSPLYRKILNEGIQEGFLRKDINIEIVIKVIVRNLNVLLDFNTFPPDRYPTDEVMRSNYLYYFRGLCVNEKTSVVDSYFSMYNF